MPKLKRTNIGASFLDQLAKVEARKHSTDRSAAGAKYGDWEREKAWKRGVTTVDASDGVYRYSLSGDPPVHLAIKEGHGLVGHRVWDGASVMGKWLERASASKDVSGSCPFLPWSSRSVIELGTGTGIVSMILANLPNIRPRRIVATDLGPVVRTAAGHVTSNGLGRHVICAELAWGDECHELAALDAAGLSPSPSELASPVAAPDCDAAQAEPKIGDAATRTARDFPLLLACDLAAPVACVPPLMATISRLFRLPTEAVAGFGAGPGASEGGHGALCVP